MNKITDIEKAYFAGLFDGEGCVKIEKYQNKSYTLRVSFGLTYGLILKEMKYHFYGSLYKVDMERKENSPSVKANKAAAVTTKKRKQIYNYVISGSDAWLFLKAIMPFCKEKKPQVDLAIIYFQGKKSNSTSLHEIERSEFYMKELQRMKQLDLDDVFDTNIVDFEDDQMDLTCFFIE